MQDQRIRRCVYPAAASAAAYFLVAPWQTLLVPGPDNQLGFGL